MVVTTLVPAAVTETFALFRSFLCDIGVCMTNVLYHVSVCLTLLIRITIKMLMHELLREDFFLNVFVVLCYVVFCFKIYFYILR